MDYTDLNKADPKDSFPLPRIDQIVDASAGHRMLSFLDAFLGYHQIPMHPPDEKKNSLHHPARAVLLQCDVVWLKECRGNVSEVINQDVQVATQKNHGGLH